MRFYHLVKIVYTPAGGEIVALGFRERRIDSFRNLAVGRGNAEKGARRSPWNCGQWSQQYHSCRC